MKPKRHNAPDRIPKKRRPAAKAPPKLSPEEIEAAAQAVRDIKDLAVKAAAIALQPWWRKFI